MDSSWSIGKSEELYRISDWGSPYFSVNAAGHAVVSPQGERGGSIDIFELVSSLQKRGLDLPLLIRFPDILEDRLDRLVSAFSRAIAKYGYAGCYRGVFPVKCNQQRHLVESLVEYGRAHKFGLEAGSKPELLIAVSALDTPGALLVCNGYKDWDYMETAMLAHRLGKNVFIVLEQLDEVKLAIQVARETGVRPSFGLRLKLTKKAQGHWGSTVGDRAKFGLSVPETVMACDLLQEAGLLDCLKLLHFHIGSQISSISVIKSALREGGRIYTELVKMGAPMGYIDVGGGLAVDYDGSRSSFFASKNYNTQNYANDVVAEIYDACKMAGVAAPDIISESGRALASHQAVLVMDVLGKSKPEYGEPPKIAEDAHYILKTLYGIYADIDAENYQESYNDAVQFKGEAAGAFQHGILSLRERAQADVIYWAAMAKIREVTRGYAELPDDLENLERQLTAIYYVNLSVFQSVPDLWAIDQLFPIMPIHRLDEEPSERVTLADLTCDSDGRIDKFIDRREDVKNALEAHRLIPLPGDGVKGRRQHEPYYLGLFLSGAYQETMGNLHNLFGDVNVAHIRLTPQGYQVQHIVRGDTMGDVLGYVQYSPEQMLENLRRQCEASLCAGSIALEESQRLLDNFEDALGHYTYQSR